MNTQTYHLKNVSTVAEMDRVYRFAVSVLGEMRDAVHTLDYYRKQVSLTPILLNYAEGQGEVIGCVLASIEEDHVLVGPTAVQKEVRGRGIGRAMLLRVEEEAKKLNQTTLILGALQESEGFYLRCGYRPNLFIQLSGVGQMRQMKDLNQQYPVVWEAEDGKWTRLMLSTPQVDRVLQTAYQTHFPGCHTQYVFIKEI